MMEKPDVDHIEGLSPAISIEQKSTSHNPRSTVGTVTEIYDYLRLLYARAGRPRCPDHGEDLEAQTVSQMVDQVLALPEGSRLMLLAPVVQERKGEHLQLFDDLRAQGFVRARVDGEVCDLDEVRRSSICAASTASTWWWTASRCVTWPGAAPGRVVRDRHEARRRRRPDRRLDGRPGAGRAAVFRPLRLPGLQLQHRRAGTAPVLLQQPGRRLPEAATAWG